MAPGAGCALCACAAKAEERRGFSLMAAAKNKTHEIAAMLRTDKRRKSSSRNLPNLDAIPRLTAPPVTQDHLP